MHGGIILRFAIFGDSKGKKNGINKKVLNRILKQIKKFNPPIDFIIHLGDMTAGSSQLIKLRFMLDEFKNQFSDMGIESIILPVFGNHEEGENPEDTASEAVFGEVFGVFPTDGVLEGYNRTVYFKDVDNTRIIVLNSCHFNEENRISAGQLAWLREVLKVKRDFKIVFVHIPAYPTGAHHGTSMDIYPEMRDEFWSVLDENNVDIVFCGHEHNYSRRVINKNLSTDKYKFRNQIYQIVSGGGGEKLRNKYRSKVEVVVPPIPRNHFVAMEILNKKIILTVYDIRSNVIDKFELNSKG